MGGGREPVGGTREPSLFIFAPSRRSQSCLHRAAPPSRGSERRPPGRSSTSARCRVAQTGCCRAAWRSESRPAGARRPPSPGEESQGDAVRLGLLQELRFELNFSTEKRITLNCMFFCFVLGFISSQDHIVLTPATINLVSVLARLTRCKSNQIKYNLVILLCYFIHKAIWTDNWIRQNEPSAQSKLMVTGFYTLYIFFL